MFGVFRWKAKWITGLVKLGESDPSLKGLSEDELGVINMMDTLIGKFNSVENQVPVDNDFMDKTKPVKEILDEIVKFRASLPEGIHQSKAGPFYYPDEKVFFRTNHENPNKKQPSIYFNFHDKCSKTKNSNQRIALIHFHGGGYLMGEPSTCYTMEKVCSTNGFDLFGVDYSLYPEHTIEDAIEDAFVAFKWVVDEKNATSVVVFGESAGGHLAIMLCMRIAQERENNPDFANDAKYDCVKACFGFSPWCDVSMSSRGMNDPNHCDRALPNKALNQFKKWCASRI